MASDRVVVLGSNFGGFTAALALKHELGDDVDVTVISPSDQFLFNPSLIWLPFGKRTAADITVPVIPPFEDHGVEFVHAAATSIDAEAKRVTTSLGAHSYDYLVIATGYRNKIDVVPGLSPENRAFTITTLPDAERAGVGWRHFLDNPGPVVIGATQGAGCFGAAYEFLFNMSYQLRKHGIRKQVQLTYVSPEPFLGHFGIGGLPHGEQLLGLFMKKERITSIGDVSIASIDDGRITLGDDRTLDYAYAMIVPPFIGQEVVHTVPGLADVNGYVTVRDTYQAVGHDDIYAVGIAAAVDVPWQTANPVGIPKTGFPTEQQAHVAANNIAAQIRGEKPQDHKEFGDIKAICVLDAGNNGVIILADKMLPPRKHGVLIPGPQAHLMKLAFEKYFLWKTEHGYVTLP
jgi:NADH dehydrogenase FAD-containing subunit